ncbi:MAG: hypothetical protein AAF251_06555 [Pseudomonadota bacterium]
MDYVFEARAENSQARLEKLRAGLSPRLKEIILEHNLSPLTIYATGSLARLECTEHSDLDAFFMLPGSAPEDSIGRICDVKVFNAVVTCAEQCLFPDFSNDGEYLRFLHVDDVVKGIGGREDDYKNSFTARMLMMLESSWLFGEGCFSDFQKRVIQAYFEDFHDHSEDFRPLFLLNDVLRFWRTLCLNYENKRAWKVEDPRNRAKGHLGNLKLKFSRMNICFSFISHLMNQGKHLTLENALATAQMTPIARLRDIASGCGRKEVYISDMLREYDWFLRVTDAPKAEALDWISDELNREEAFRHAHQFVRSTGDLVRDISEENEYLRYLLV